MRLVFSRKSTSSEGSERSERRKKGEVREHRKNENKLGEVKLLFGEMVNREECKDDEEGSEE